MSKLYQEKQVRFECEYMFVVIPCSCVLLRLRWEDGVPSLTLLKQ